MSYNTKNYTEQGGDKTVIGGTLEIKEGAIVTGLPSTGYTLPQAIAEALGGVKASPKLETDTVEAKIGENGKLYVPGYPTIPETQTIPVAENQTASTAATVEALVTDFNALLAKLKSAGIMAADE